MQPTTKVRRPIYAKEFQSPFTRGRIFCDSPLKRGDFVVMVRQAHHERHYILSLSKDQSNDKVVCKFAATHPQPLFLEGS